MTGKILNRREWLALSAAATAIGAAPALATAPPRIRVDLNESAYGPSPTVPPAIARSTAGIERYVDQGEVDALAQRIAAIEQVAPDQVVIGEVLEAIGLVVARARPGGGGIVFSTPGYTALVDAAAPLGGRAVPVPLNDRLENDLPALASAVDADTLAVSLINPHNPSGTVNAAQAFHAFVADTARRTLVVVDEAYLEYEDLAGRSAMRHVREGRNVLVFRTLAKIYGLAGLPIGYAVAPRALAGSLRAAGIGAPHSLSRPAIAAAAAALADQNHVATVRSTVIAERQRFTAALDRLGLRHTDSRANFVFFASPRADVVRRSLAEQGIEVGRAFPPLDDWIRITIGLPEENRSILRALETAQRHLRRYRAGP